MRRVSVALFLVFLLAFPLTGCHAPFEGSLTGRDGTGSGPSPAPGQASITSVSPGTVSAGGPSFTLTVNGQNFLQTTTVLWNDNTALTTTYVSSTVLQAQVPASLIAKPGSVEIIASPMGSLNFGANFTVATQSLTGNNSFSVSMVPVQANDMVFDQVHQQFYLSVTSGNATNANTIVALNPQTASLGSSISTNGGAGKLAVSSDGAYLYAGLNNAGSVQRYTIPAAQLDIAIPLGSGSYGPYYAIDVEVEPGNSHSVAIARGAQSGSIREVGGIFIYDDAVARAQSVPGFGPVLGPIDSIVWNPNGHSLYGLDTETVSSLSIMSVSSGGVQFQTQFPSAGSSLGNNLQFDLTTGFLYTDTGEVLDSGTGAVIANFPLNAVQGVIGLNPVMVPDGKLNIAYFLSQTSNAGNCILEAFDLTRFTFLGAIPITNVSGTPTKIVRWGSNGLAFLTSGAAGDGVYLVSGGFVTSPAP
jgi:hypothetical protein